MFLLFEEIDIIYFNLKLNSHESVVAQHVMSFWLLM